MRRVRVVGRMCADKGATISNLACIPERRLFSHARHIFNTFRVPHSLKTLSFALQHIFSTYFRLSQSGSAGRKEMQGTAQ